MFQIVNIVLGLLLAILVFTIVVKKILIDFKGTDKGIVNIAIIVVGLVGLLCSLCVFSGVFNIDQLTELLNTQAGSNFDVNYVKQQISSNKVANIRFLIIGYISIVIEIAIFKIIQRKSQLNSSKGNNRWNL